MVRITSVTRLARITGAHAVRDTASRFGVHATDLGIPWRARDGGVLVAFGDTYGAGWGGHGPGPPEADWRFNVLAHGTDAGLDSGLVLDCFVARPDGTAAQVIPPWRPSEEHTVIPTSGISVGGREYLHYMSVRRWGKPGRWRTWHAGLACSDDGGRTWSKPRGAVWPNRRGGPVSRPWRRNTHPFQLVAFAGVLDGWVYLLGTPNGRYGDGRLARAPADALLEPRAYQYWNGRSFGTEVRAAAAVLGGPVGELSVRYNSFFGRWLATHLDERRAEIVLRTAPSLIGPWTDGQTLVSAEEYPALYGGFQHPHGCDRPRIYFTVSHWWSYNVDLFRAELA
ncbi:DUF4185 domain-containing protein [Actinopolyspora mortivallis]|uniref:DUF4185 domain-containing protein n=1 Tax=Actinopolyspora mortivallis TaxID=33906 RepID=UPI0003612D01|nr:DUF4185 domain-containing protein [Actinopolyspora mortivallis]